MPRALEQIRRMWGGAQSHLMRYDDGYDYVVKFQNNLQHRRILVHIPGLNAGALRLGPVSWTQRAVSSSAAWRWSPFPCLWAPTASTSSVASSCQRPPQNSATTARILACNSSADSAR